MDADDRRRIINAIDNESQAKRNRIYESFTSFVEWIKFALQMIYRKYRDKLRKLWNWITG